MDGNQAELQQNDMDVVKKMEDEHLHLQRQVRMIQADRTNQFGGIHPQFRRQDALLRTLKKEYKSLCLDLKIARSGAHKKKDKKMRIGLKTALKDRIHAEHICDAGVISSRQIEDLTARTIMENMEVKNSVMSTEGELQERQTQSELRLMSAENKLETAMLRFNTLCYENKKIREEIEHMMKDRQQFNQSWEKMLTALRKGKKFLADLFESSTLAYDQRDEWCFKLKQMQEKGRIDQMLQVQEMRDLMKAYDNDMKLYNFYYKKGMTRVNQHQENKEEEDRRREEDETKTQTDHHTSILRKISTFTSRYSIAEVAKQFQRTEQENFSIYKLMMEYCAENEVLRREVARLRQNAVDYQDYNEMQETARDKKVEGIRKDLEDAKNRTEELRSKNEEKTAWIENTMGSIKEMFELLNCSDEPFQRLLGDKGPSVYNLRLTMTLITEKIKEDKQNAFYCERVLYKKQGITSTSVLKKYTVFSEPISIFNPTPINLLVPTDPCPSCIESRWMTRVCDDLEVPFDRQMALTAIRDLSRDTAFDRSDRIHALTDCKMPRSRAILARRYMNL